jgi:hypothetical protein
MLRMVAYFTATVGLIVVSYSFLPLILPTFTITFPGTGITAGIIILVMLLAIIGFTAVKFAINAFALAGVRFETLAYMMPGITSEHSGSFKRVLMNLFLIILVVVAAQTVTAAIVVLLV